MISKKLFADLHTTQYLCDAALLGMGSSRVPSMRSPSNSEQSLSEHHSEQSDVCEDDEDVGCKDDDGPWASPSLMIRQVLR